MQSEGIPGQGHLPENDTKKLETTDCGLHAMSVSQSANYLAFTTALLALVDNISLECDAQEF